MENNDDKEKEVKPQDSSHDPVPPSQEPEKKPDEGRKEAKPKKNVYDQYRYWGSGGSPEGGGPSGGRRNRIALFAFVLLLISFTYIFLSTPTGAEATETSYTAFMSAVESGDVYSADIVESSRVDYILLDGRTMTCRIPYADMDLLDKLEENGVTVTGSIQPTPFWYIIIQLLPWVIFIVMIVMIMRQTGTAGGNRMMSSFGKSHAQMYGKNDKKVNKRHRPEQSFFCK